MRRKIVLLFWGLCLLLQQVSAQFPNPYCNISFTNNIEPITLVNFAGINNVTSAPVNGTPVLEDFTAITGNVMTGSSYLMTVKGNTDGNFTTYIRVFIDWNQNNVLNDAGEVFDIGTITNSTGVDAIQVSANIAVPAGALAGNTRMRVMKRWNGYSTDPCQTGAGYGQGEDYTLLVVLPAPCSGVPSAGTISPATYNRCSGQTVALTSTGVTSGVLGITNQWQVSATPGGPYTNVVGGTGATTTSYTSAALTTGTYYYVLKTKCSTGPDSSYSNEAMVTVNPTPTASASNNGPICPGQTVNLTGTTDIGTTYSWSGPASFTSTNQNPTILSATPSMAGIYTFTATAGGCTSANATTTLSVLSAPLSVTAFATPPSICVGNNSQLVANSSSPGPVNTYLFSTSTGVTLNPMTGATTVIGTGNDDTPTGAPASIGFTFNYNGTNYTQYSVSPDGWILLGGATAVNQFTNAVASTTNIPKIYPYWDDVATGTTGNVKVLVTGTAPNRIFIVQWFVTIPRNTGGAANSTFQAWLYEADGKIEFRYGTMGAATMSSSVGLTAAAANFNCVTISSNTNNTVTVNNGNAGQPANGRMYTFNLPPATTTSWTPTTFLSNPNIFNPVATGMTTTTTYVVTASNGGCGLTDTITVNVDPTLVTLNPINVACFGDSTGSFSINTVVCGTAPFTYSVNGGAFASIPTNLTPATYSVVVRDNNGFDGSPVSVVITQPLAPTSDPVSTTGVNVCTGASSALISALGGPGSVLTVDTVVITFDVATSPVEGTVNPGTIFTSTTLPAFPAGSTVTSATLTYPNVTSTSPSFMSEVRLALTGAINSPGIAGNGTATTAGTFNYIRPVTPGSINTAGGTVNMGYWESFNDGIIPDATFPTGSSVANVTIIYTYPLPTAISWWDAATGGTMQGSGIPLETVGTLALPNANTSGTYTFYAQGEEGGCPSVNRLAATVIISDVVAYLSPINIQCNGGNDGSFALDSFDCGNIPFIYAVDGGAFGPIPNNLAPGNHTIVVQDNIGGLSDDITLVITQPSWMPDVPTVNPGNIDLCVGDASALFTIPSSGSITIPFDVPVSPIESPSPGTLFATATMPALPAGAIITSATITYAGINSQGGSFNSEVRLGFNGAINDLGATGIGSMAIGGVFTYTRTIAPAAINPAGGTVNMLYWESFNDGVVPDAIFPTGTAVANIVINFTVNGLVSADSVNWYDAASGGNLIATNDSLEAVGTTILPNTNTPGTYTFYAEGFYHGCTSATRTAVTVNIGAYPVVNLGSDATYCNNHLLNAGNPGMNYLWNDSSMNQTLNALDTGLYYVDVTSVLGCTTRDSIDLVINPLPTVNLGPDTVSCGSYLLDPGTQPVTSTFLWNDMSTGSTLFITTSGDFDVTVTDINGCTNADTATVNVPPITYTNIGPDTTLCTNDDGFILDATVVGVDYLWQDGSTNATFFVDLPGTYWVTITNFVGCTSTDSIVIVSVDPVQTNIDVNFVTTHSATLDAGSGFNSYLWSTSANTQIITVNTNGTYFVTVSDQNNCITTDAVTIVFSLGIFNPNGTTTTMKLYPNPSEGAFNLSIDNLETSNLVVDVLDLNGKVVYNRVIGAVAGSTIEPFNLTDLSMGTYILRLNANGKTSQLRFIIGK